MNQSGSASYEAVNWKIVIDLFAGRTIRSASYEAVNWKRLARLDERKRPEVSLVWGCELKGRMDMIILLWIRSASYEAVNWKIATSAMLSIGKGQPRMRLWIERRKAQKVFSKEIGQPRMRLWIESFANMMKVKDRKGQPRMRLWIERWITSHYFFLLSRSASYEAVNWKTTASNIALVPSGQPRMRLWIERYPKKQTVVRSKGQPRMRLWIERTFDCVIFDAIPVSLVWGCELKDNIIKDESDLEYGQPRMRLWIERNMKKYNVI